MIELLLRPLTGKKEVVQLVFQGFLIPNFVTQLWAPVVSRGLPTVGPVVSHGLHSSSQLWAAVVPRGLPTVGPRGLPWSPQLVSTMV